MDDDQVHNKVVQKGNILEIVLASHQSPETLAELKNQIKKLSGDQALDILVDASAIELPSPETRPAAASFFDDFVFQRYAVFGGKPATNLGLRGLFGSNIGDDKVKMFRREIDARAWLSEDASNAK